MLRFVRGEVAQVATYLSGDFEIIEAEIKQGSQADGAMVSELGLPKDVLIGAYVRDGKPRSAGVAASFVAATTLSCLPAPTQSTK